MIIVDCGIASAIFNALATWAKIPRASGLVRSVNFDFGSM
jgi:hypothetical protein